MGHSSFSIVERVCSTSVTLIRRIRDQEDHLAWERLSKRYRGGLRRMARLAGLNAHDAEDIAQEVLAHVSKSIDRFELRPRSRSSRSWLRSIAQRKIWTLFRRNSRVATLPDLHGEGEDDDFFNRLPSEALDPAMEMELQTRKQMLRLAIHRLLRRYHPATLQIFQLYVIEGMEIEKVAELHGRSCNAVHMIRNRLTPVVRQEVRALTAQARYQIKLFGPPTPDDTLR